MRRSIIALAWLVAATGGLAAQQQPPRQPGAPHQALQVERMQQMQQQMDRLAEQLRETNRWMAENRTRQPFQDLGKAMEQTGERMRDMLREMDRVRQAPDLLRTRGEPARNRERTLEFDRLQQRVTDLTRNLDQAHASLRSLVGKP